MFPQVVPCATFDNSFWTHRPKEQFLVEGRKESIGQLFHDWGNLLCAKTLVICLFCLFWGKQLKSSCGMHSLSSSFFYYSYYVFPILCFIYLFFEKLMGVLAFCFFFTYFILIWFLLLSVIILRFIYAILHSSFFFCLPEKE